MYIIANLKGCTLRICKEVLNLRSLQGHVKVKPSKLYSSKVMYIIGNLKGCTLRICKDFKNLRSFKVISRSNLQNNTKTKLCISLATWTLVLQGSVKIIRVKGHFKVISRSNLQNYVKKKQSYVYHWKPEGMYYNDLLWRLGFKVISRKFLGQTFLITIKQSNVYHKKQKMDKKNIMESLNKTNSILYKRFIISNKTSLTYY